MLRIPNLLKWQLHRACSLSLSVLPSTANCSSANCSFNMPATKRCKQKEPFYFILLELYLPIIDNNPKSELKWVDY